MPLALDLAVTVVLRSVSPLMLFSEVVDEALELLRFCWVCLCPRPLIHHILDATHRLANLHNKILMIPFFHAEKAGCFYRTSLIKCDCNVDECCQRKPLSVGAHVA